MMIRRLLHKKEFNAEHEVKNLHNVVSRSFGNVQADVSHLMEWINYLNGNVAYLQGELERMHGIIVEQDSTIQQQHAHLSGLQSQLDDAPLGEEDIRQMIDLYYSNDDIYAQLEDLKSRLSHTHGLHEPLVSRINRLHERVDELESRNSSQKVSYKEKILAKITRNSKDYVKNMVSSLVRKYGRISAMQLREIIVDEQGLCSKSSFYRLLSEIEQEGGFDTILDGKEKVFLARISENILANS